MKSSRISILSILAVLVFTAQVVWAATPGSGVTGEKKDRRMHDRQTQQGVAAESPVTDMELMAVEEALLIKENKPAPTRFTPKQKPVRKPKTSSAEPAVENTTAARQTARQKRQEKRAAMKKLRAMAKAHKAAAEEASAPAAPHAGGNPGLFILLALFIPPLAVFLWMGDVTTEFWLNVLLTLMFWIPGIIHAIVVIMR